jgi:hypothetical protein
MMLVKIAIVAVLLLGILPAIAYGQAVPTEIWGKWEIARELPTRTISCWGESDARRIIGTQIEYSDKIFRWKDVMIRNPKAEEKVVTADEFRAENSSPSANGSQVDFGQLGIRAKQAREISIGHNPAHITDATVEIPGDNLLVKNQDTIIFSVCNSYFEAKRIPEKK